MTGRLSANVFTRIDTLLDLIERRFGLRLEPGNRAHLQTVFEHYRDKREALLREYGEAGALAREEYAKAVLLSEAARLMILREIDPRPRKRKKKNKDISR